MLPFQFRPNSVYLFHKCSPKTVSIIEYISGNNVSLRQSTVKKTTFHYSFSLQIKHQWPSKIKITIYFHSIGLHFDFMNPIKQKTNVLPKLLKQWLVLLAPNIILEACQWYSGSKICLKSWCLLFFYPKPLRRVLLFNCRKSPGPIPPTGCSKDPTGMIENLSWQLWLSVRLLTDEAKCSRQLLLINNFLLSTWNLLCVKVVNEKL